MADPKDGKTQSEPTMEEILASIRKIIADEKEPVETPEPEAPAPVKEEDVLELTQLVQDDGSIVDLSAPAAQPPPPPPPPPPVTPPPPSADSLLSARAASATTASLATLTSTLQIERMAASVPMGTPLGNGARTLEDMVADLIRPMLKDWLDQNLPAIVERLVQKEIERIVHRVQD